MQSNYCVTDELLDPDALTKAGMSESNGAVITFLGVVRRQSRGHLVEWLEYEAYPAMAEKQMAAVGDEVSARWPIEYLSVHHRTGKMVVGEVSLVVVIGSPHRKEAFEAAQYCVDRIKEVVPIWKKEVWEGGEVWIEGDLPSVTAAAEAAQR
ncbi:MAG: molybdenum cofactor biosynthesis protein MoaE [Chloroflexi bacterium]|nr:molybdenum cofactor biosynthesis protein MoaE [Chloroflexota bacterium]